MDSIWIKVGAIWIVLCILVTAGTTKFLRWLRDGPDLLGDAPEGPHSVTPDHPHNE